MKLLDDITKIEEYLSSWYNALPIPAIHILFYLYPNELYLISERDFEDRISELRLKWDDMNFIERVHHHDRLETKFSEFTSHVTLNK